MTLRLSSSANNNTTPTSVDAYMKQITDDTSLSLAQKSDCLKTLAVVLKNLLEATKGAAEGEAGAKYRTLKTDNPKLRSRLFCSPGVRNLLLDPALVGMASRDNTLILEGAPSPEIRDSIGLKILPAVSVARQEIDARIAAQTSTTTSSKKARLTEHNHNQNATGGGERLSEKQKARRMLEEKQRLEKEREKAFRKETRAKIAADKLVRQKDENWKPSVSAAADKTGTGLLTFRDRHGE